MAISADWLPGYSLRQGSRLDRALLVKFIQQTYQELFPTGTFTHLAATVEQYFSAETPLWLVIPASNTQPIACLWLGNAIDQVMGDRHAHIFLLYVAPDYRRQGIGSALVRQAEIWARARGDRQLGLQVFQTNQPALQLYRQLGFQPQALWMAKPLYPEMLE